MTRADHSDDPNSDSSAELPYHESLQTTHIPTKSGTEVANRLHHQSDDHPSKSGLSSRPSSRGELDGDDEEFIKNCSVAPSAAEFAIQTKTFVKPLTESHFGHGFAFEKAKAPSTKASGISQSTQSSQSSQAVPPDSFEKSNQEHQVSARSAHQGPSLAAIPQGLDKMFSWLSSWLTLNIQAPGDLQKDVQPTDSPLFQNILGDQVQKTSLTRDARPSVPQLFQKQPRRKR